MSTPGQANEDLVATGSTWAFVLDGATPRAGVDSGCVHTVTWLVAQLGAALSRQLFLHDRPLSDLVAAAIDETCGAHGPACDLSNPDSPSSTVAVIRENSTSESVDYLILADSPVVFDTADGVQVVTDTRSGSLPVYTAESVRAARNQPDGFWVASTKPEAAYQAVIGSVDRADVRRAAAFTDGAARYTERFALGSWADALDLLESDPGCLIKQVRAAEGSENAAQQARRRDKQHDDATAVLMTWD
ncbi:protein phosphatase 2C domain-containing protein [Streptodolium elevatio]|uniref:Protein phosphatase 2C domain-containing protein n=1 Tax=Streptodolium elevatio TaxID=3157996 RepID=A0ABV3DL76_9ACTN